MPIKTSSGRIHARSAAEPCSILLALTPPFVSTHSTPSHGGVSCLSRWRKLRRPALINSAAPISRNQVLVVIIEPFTATSTTSPNSYELADLIVSGKVCSHHRNLPIGPKPKPIQLLESPRIWKHGLFGSVKIDLHGSALSVAGSRTVEVRGNFGGLLSISRL